MSGRTVHPGTLTGHHAWNRILEHQPVRPFLTLLLLNHIAFLINRTNGPSKHTSSSKVHIRKRLATACAIIGPAYDIRAKVSKHVL